VILLLFVPVILLGVATALAFNSSLTLGYTLLALTVIAFLLMAIVSSALQTIFLTALYQFAAFERVPVGFEADTLQHAFKVKTPKAA